MKQSNITPLRTMAAFTGGTEIPVPEEVKLTCLDDVAIRPVDWLWDQYIACGKITVIAGGPGEGKSQIAANIAATVTTGGKWPCGNSSAPCGDVLLISAEDDAGDTIKPRLVATGADIRRCHILESVRIHSGKDAGKSRGLNLCSDVGSLEPAIMQIRDIKLIIIDPMYDR
jgi:putative DNA primase/helicase